jgi:hypothetical protein
MLGKRVSYRGRIGTVVEHSSVTELWGKTVVISFPEHSDHAGEKVSVPQHLWPLIKVLDS